MGHYVTPYGLINADTFGIVLCENWLLIDQKYLTCDGVKNNQIYQVIRPWDVCGSNFERTIFKFTKKNISLGTHC